MSIDKGTSLAISDGQFLEEYPNRGPGTRTKTKRDLVLRSISLTKALLVCLICDFSSYVCHLVFCMPGWIQWFICLRRASSTLFESLLFASRIHIRLIQPSQTLLVRVMMVGVGGFTIDKFRWKRPLYTVTVLVQASFKFRIHHLKPSLSTIIHGY